MKIAVLGGSFNPIHNGHIELANAVSEHLQCHKLLLIPTKTPPHKSADEYVADEHRMNMCYLAAEKIRNCEVSDIEISQDRVSYTYLTLNTLKEQYKDAEIYLICGSDMFLTLQSWKNPDIIFKQSVICAVPRAGEDMSVMTQQKSVLEQLGAKVTVLPVDIKPYSSTQIRERLAENLSVDDMLLPEIQQYIKQNRLYGDVKNV
ncbi:MAG: nicotinate (nicotinamide) nucleotide adenylyltransferase [Clostridia bacterium]|nr:nicotinate (nicotinamide) nucleotide adenylyltransferase [Clostridia bacterium]